MSLRDIISVFFVFITVWFGFINGVKMIRGHELPWLNLFIMAVGLTGIITRSLNMW